MSICSQEIGKMHMDAQNMVKHLTEILEGEDRCPSPTPIDEAKNLAALEAEKAAASQGISEESLRRLEQEQQWANYQAEAGKEIVNQHLSKVKETGVAFLRSHSTPVSELEALYEQQQKEIEAQKQRIIALGSEKDKAVDDELKKQIEEQIIASQKQIIESQEKQKEIERKKHVRFQEEAEHKRRESLQVQQLEFEEKRRIREAQQIEQEQKRRYEEAQKRNQEEKQQAVDQTRLLNLESLRERARTPVAALEAYERDDEMSPKTEKIFHTYEQLIQSEDEIQVELPAKPETPKAVPIRPLTPARGISPFPGSIPLAEKSLLLKNIQGIEFEFEQANPKKPEPKKFKLPDLRNLGKSKPLTFAQTPSAVEPPKPEQIAEVKKTEAELKEQAEAQERLQKQQLIQQQLKEVEEKRKQAEFEEQQLLLQNQYLEQSIVDQKKFQIQQEKIQHQQIKEQRKQVHEELAQNEKFKRKQETLGPPKPKYERSKTPVAELEEQERNREQSDRTKQIYSSYDQVLSSEERPRSRIGQPVPETQTLSEAEKSLFFQNIQGINYEFENITELSATKHLAEHEKSQFIKSVENRTKSPVTVTQPPIQPKPDIYQSAFVNALTTMPDTAARQLKPQKSYEEYKEEQERLYQQQKIEQQIYYEQQRLLQQQKQKTIPTNLVSALTIAPDRPYSPLPSAPATIPQKVPLPEQTAPYIPEKPGETKSMIDALTIAPEKPFAPQIFDAGSIDNAILNTERKVQVTEQRRQSLGFPGVNVQRTPYQMLKGEQIKSAFEEELKSQETAINQFLSKKEESFKSTSVVETQKYQSLSQQQTSSTIQASIAPGFGLIPASPQIAYAPPPPADKRAELVASQAKFGSQIEVKQEKPRQEPKPLSRPMTMIEALTTAPERPYSPFPEVPKPQATLVCGGAAVALTKGETYSKESQEQISQPHIEVKPIYQVKDVQLSKDKIGATGFSEEKREKQQEAGLIKGEGITGAYQKSEERFESVQQTSSEKKGQKIEIPPLPLPPIVEQDTPKEVAEIKSFPPVSDQLKSETKQSIQALQQSSQSIQQQASISQQSASFLQSSVQQSSSQQVSQKVTRSEDSTKVVERRVTEVIESESSRKEFSQVKITGNIDPRTGLRRTSSENFLTKSSQSSQIAASGLQKASAIPLYQTLLSDQPVLERMPVAPVESKNFQARPRSVHGLQPSKSTDKIAEKAQDAKVPLAFRSRTPVPLPTITFAGEPVKASEPAKRNFPTYNQTEVYRSASPRPIPVPKQQLGTYFGQAGPKQTLQPGGQLAYRSTSPVPVPKLLGSAERYQQPVTRRTVQPKEQPQPRVSWPPQPSSEPLPVSQYTPKKFGEQQQPVVPQQPSRPKSAGKKVSWPPQEATVEVSRQEELPENLHTQNIVREQINLQEQQVLKNVKTITSEAQKKTAQSILSKTNVQSKGPAPKSDPITAPRPFGTPTPQRKIATPHFQPIKPVAITQGQSTNITAPKLTFSTTKSSSITETSLERKTSLTNSSDSAFKPIDVSPIKPTPFKPLSTFVNANIDTAVLPSMNGLAKTNVPQTNIQKPTQNIQSSVQNIQKSIPKPDPIGKEPQNKQGSEVDKSGNSGGGAGGAKGGTFAGATTPRRGKGVLNPPNALRIPLCASCNGQIRGPFITALGKIWCPEHFICTNAQCRRPLADIGFVEEEGQGLFCEFCFEKYIAPSCDKCTKKIKGDCLNAIGKHFHPECFNCAYCGKLFGNSPFFLEDGLPYCEADWNELFTTKCFACGFPIEAGDRWVEALNNNYHSQCFNCTMCKKNLEGQSFYAKGGRPFCKNHAR